MIQITDLNTLLADFMKYSVGLRVLLLEYHVNKTAFKNGRFTLFFYQILKLIKSKSVTMVCERSFRIEIILNNAKTFQKLGCKNAHQKL